MKGIEVCAGSQKGRSLRAFVLHRQLIRALVASLALALAAPATADIDFSDPLIVPDEPLPLPETSARNSVPERVQSAAASLRAHGYEELPVLAWALLEAGRDAGDSIWIERAASLAPNTPSVRYEAARLQRSPQHLVAAFVALFTSFPGLLWLSQLLGAALGAGVLAGVAVALVAVSLRSLPQHAHALGHLGNSKDSAGFPALVLGFAAIALLPLLGAGPALLLALVGALACLRLTRAEAWRVGLALALAGLCLGPLVDGWSRVAATQGANSQLLAIWRVNRSQPLPGDIERIEAASRQAPRDLVLRLALATAYKRAGDLDGALETIGRQNSTDRELLADSYNLRGVIELARGNAKTAIHELEEARATHASAPVLFNLSQAYGRALRLVDQQPVFNAARKLDRDLVQRFSELGGRSIHDFLIQAPLPLRVFIQRAIQANASAGSVAREVRDWTLGARMPDHAWFFLPLLGLLAIFARRSNIQRCRRCGRSICRECNPEAKERENCVRCSALFGRGTISDPRVHGEQLRHERQRLRLETRVLAVVGLLLPGAPDVYRGFIVGGLVRLVLSATGIFLLFFSDGLSTPWEVGALRSVLPGMTGFAILVVIYGRAGLTSMRSFSQTRVAA